MLSNALRQLDTVDPTIQAVYQTEIDSIFEWIRENPSAVFGELPSASEQAVNALRTTLRTILAGEKSPFETQQDKPFYDAIFAISIALAWQFPINQKNASNQPYDDLFNVDEESLTPDNAIAMPHGRLYKNVPFTSEQKEPLTEYFRCNNAFHVDVRENSVVPYTPDNIPIDARTMSYLKEKGIVLRTPSIRELGEAKGVGGHILGTPVLPSIDFVAMPGGFGSLVFHAPEAAELLLFNALFCQLDSVIEDPPLSAQPLSDKIIHPLALFCHILLWMSFLVGSSLLLFIPLACSSATLGGVALFAFSMVTSIIAPTLIHALNNHPEDSSASNKLGSFCQAITIFSTLSIGFSAVFSSCILGGMTFFMPLSIPLVVVPIIYGAISLSAIVGIASLVMRNDSSDLIKSLVEGYMSVEKQWIQNIEGCLRQCWEGIKFPFQFINTSYPSPTLPPPSPPREVTSPRSFSSLDLHRALFTSRPRQVVAMEESQLIDRTDRITFQLLRRFTLLQQLQSQQAQIQQLVQLQPPNTIQQIIHPLSSPPSPRHQ